MAPDAQVAVTRLEHESTRGGRHDAQGVEISLSANPRASVLFLSSAIEPIGVVDDHCLRESSIALCTAVLRR